MRWLPWIDLLALCVRSGGSAFPRQPIQAVRAWPRRLVLEGDMTGVAALLDAGQVVVEIQGPGAGLATARVISDLDMGDAVRVRVQRAFDVVAVVGQVEKVTQEADISCARL